MEELGATLREARERRGLTLEEVERQLRIRSHLLDALERGDLESLASQVQARGFLRNYAGFLGVDGQALLQSFDERKRTTRPPSRAVLGGGEPSPRPSVAARSRLPRWLNADLLIAAGVTLTVLLTLIWGGGRVMAAMRERTAEEVAASGFLIPTSSSTPEPALATAVGTDVALEAELAIVPIETFTPTPTPTFLLAAVDRVDLRLVVQQRAWILVEVDGREAFRGQVIPGDLLEYQAERLIEVLISNAAALHVFYEGEDLGLLGELGQIVRRLWSLEGVLTPTPTASPTLTPTPRFAPTLTGTPTP